MNEIELCHEKREYINKFVHTMFKQFFWAAIITFVGFFVLLVAVWYHLYTSSRSLNDSQASVGIAVIILSGSMICIGTILRYYIYRKSQRRFEARFRIPWPYFPYPKLVRMELGDKRDINYVTTTLIIAVGCPPRG